MVLKLTAPPQLPDGMTSRELAQAAARGVSDAVKRHMAARDARGGDGDMRSGYWGDAAASVRTEMAGKAAVVTIHKEGVALHFFGGVVYPVDAKALAIPQTPQTAGRRPAEIDPAKTRFALVWPKGKKTGTLRDRKTGEDVYLLVSKAKIEADPSVVPTDDELYAAGEKAMERAMRSIL